jgi:regulator of protease activity HflC (stomatin/prohibitin superfamily)
MEVLIAIILLALIAGFIFVRGVNSVTVYEYEKGLRYVNGALKGVVGTGRYRNFGIRTRIVKQDMRVQPLTITGQEMPTKDNAGIRLSLAGHYQIVNLTKALHDNSKFQHDLHIAVQLALREVVSNLTLDELLASRGTVDVEVLKIAQPKLASIGVEIKDLAVRDIILPASLKKSLAGVIEAKKDALKNLEKTRGEQAVLRNLANAARMFEENPQLLNARLVQALEQGGNTLVFGTDGFRPSLKKRTHPGA